MSLVDRTNETITLSLEEGFDATIAGVFEPATLNIDVDHESSRTPTEIVWLMFATDNEPWFKLTYEEAELVYQRLGLILGKTA